MVSVRNSSQKLDVFAVNAWGMLYASLLLGFLPALNKHSFAVPVSFSYIRSLLYLSIFGTPLAFAFFYILLRDMAPEKASYTLALFPIVAALISTVVEYFQWTTTVILGFCLVMIGNILVLKPVKTPAIKRF